jgi:chromosome segregation ATPase
MLETKNNEIKRLEESAKLRKDGLTCSEAMLETDTKSFLKFFNEIKENTQDASKRLDVKRREKNDKNNKLREINDKIQGLVSTINKNVEILQQQYTYKQFLDSLASADDKKEMERINEIKKAKRL